MDSRSDVMCERRPLAQAADADPAGVDPSGADEQINRMEAFRGSLKSYCARPELQISAFDFELSAGAASEARSGPCLIVVVLLEGSGESRFAALGGRSDVLSIRYEAGMTYLFFSPHPASGGYRAAAATRFRGVEVRVGLDLLDRLGGLERLRDAAQGSHPLRFAAAGGGWIGGFPTPLQLRTAALQVLDPPAGGDHDLIIEARALDILTAAMTAMRQPLFCRGARVIRNARQIEDARALMLADLARPWTVREVARRVGLAEKRLKVDFRSRFGLPVYGFLQHSRLERARAMLETGTASVTEAAMAVGYANPSHFAKLFRRQFGIAPSIAARGLGSPPKVAR